MIKRFLHIFGIHKWSDWYPGQDYDIRYKWRTCWLCDKTEEEYLND